MDRRVVVTGMGVVAPNGNDLQEFEISLRKGRSGVRFLQELEELNFRCQVAGVPQCVNALLEHALPPHQLIAMNSIQKYATLAALEAWADAALPSPGDEAAEPLWDTGAIVGSGVGGMDTVAAMVPSVSAGEVRSWKRPSLVAEQAMASGVSARLAETFALGNQVSSNSSACSTGTDAIVSGYRMIRCGFADRMLCGSAEGESVFTWAPFDAMRILSSRYNDRPEQASRPMSADAAGFVPAAGAGILVLESLESALRRGAPIRAEVLGAATTCGGHRRDGSMTRASSEGMRRCIRAALDDAGRPASDVDLVSGHLTSTANDPRELAAWSQALERPPEQMPWITATKSLTGHALGGAGGMQAVATILMLQGGFVHPSLNAEELHPEIVAFEPSIPREPVTTDLRVAMKAGFGFGDVASCVAFGRA